MAYARVALSFMKLSDAKLVIFADHVITCLTGNSEYPTPNPPLSIVQTALTEFQEKLAEAVGGGVVRTAHKNAAREALLTKLRSLALYVQEECGGELPRLLTAGYEATKTPAPAGILPAPEGVTLTQGTLSGSLNLRGSAPDNAASFEMQTTTQIANPASWATAGQATAPRMTLDGLTPGTTYWSRMRAIGSAGPGAWSEPVSAMAI